MPELKREDLLFFGNSFYPCDSWPGGDTWGAMLQCCTCQSELPLWESVENKASCCLDSGFEGLVVWESLWQTGWKLDIVLPSTEEILPVSQRLQPQQSQRGATAGGVGRDNRVEITVRIACAPQTPAFTPCLPNPDDWGREQREHSSLGRLKSCCTLEIETLGAVMSSSLRPYCSCGG